MGRAKLDGMYIGAKFGNWVVISEPFRPENSDSYCVMCRCNCESKTEIAIVCSELRSGQRVRCQECAKQAKRKVHKDDVFGKWTVLHLAERTPGRRWRKWVCRCECGNTANLSSTNLLQKQTTQCMRCRAQAALQGHIDGTHEYTWRHGAEERDIEISVTWEYCKGILAKQGNVCALSGVDIHLATSMAELDGGLNTASLDRIDNDKGYVEGNLQWVHKHVNIAKKDHSQSEFIAMCIAVANTHPNHTGQFPEPEVEEELSEQMHCAPPAAHTCRPSGSGFAVLQEIIDRQSCTPTGSGFAALASLA